MREIKFRAWDSHSKQMITDVLVWTRKDGWTSVLLPHGIKNEKAYAVIGDHWKTDDFGNKYSDLNVVIPMQYTGLKGKNGVEIYEGDVVLLDYRVLGVPPRTVQLENRRLFGKDGSLARIQFNEAYGSFELVTRSHFGGWDTPKDQLWLTFNDLEHNDIGGDYGNQLTQIEVIGNIYENPELLTPSNQQVGKQEEDHE